MNSKRLVLSFFLVLSLLLAPFAGAISIASAAPLAAPTCHSSSPTSGAYTVSLCFTVPAANAILTGNTTVTATATVTGTNPGVQRMIFYLNSLYQLTDYQSPYTFTLPTAKWVDGAYSLSVSALMRDAFTSQQTIMPVTFSNGVTTPPVNTNTFHPSAGLPANGSPFVVVAVGDGASGETSAVNVSNLIGSLNPNLLLYLGDVYEKGSPLEFFNWYGAQTNNFGTYKAITNPTIGNHEYSNSSTAAGYFDYWDNIPNYYSYNAGGWHFISLNSNQSRIGVTSTSPQYLWLQQDLAANAQTCTIAYYHHPLFNIGPEGSTTQMSAIWSLLAQSGVEMVINGHDHTYQRWVPLNGSGQPSANGITEFVAGASGHGLQTIKTSDTRVAYSIDVSPTAFGALKLTLNTNGASFQYVNTSGTVLDSGTVPCVPFGPDTQAPTVPTGVTATSPSHYQVNLSWSASSDNVGVTGYRISRNGSVLVSVPGSSLSYLDSTASPSTQYSYTVDAFDQAGNHSAPSAPVNVTTLAMPASLTIPSVADTYVSASSPTTNYGTATTFRMDASPDLHSYLRFQVQGTMGVPITRATLKIYSNTTSSIGVQALGVSNTTWGETTTNFNNAPALGSVLASSGAMTANTWVSLNITPYITGDGTYSLGVQTTSSSAMSFQSKEATTNKPQLLLEFGPIADTQAPGKPGGVNAAAAGSSQINLSWTASTDNVGVTGYSIFRNAALVTTVPSSSLSYQDINLTPSTTYSYTLDAFDLAGNHSALSAPVNATTAPLPDTQAPTVPANVNGAATGTPQVNLTWSASTDNIGVTGYTIYRGGVSLTTVSGSTLSYTDLAVSPSTNYIYTVDAFDLAANHSAVSAPVNVTTPALSDTQAPSIPSGVGAVSPNPNQVNLAWNASTDNVGVTGYSIYRNGANLTTVPGNVLTYSDTTVVPSTSYAYTVDAYDLAGNHSSVSTAANVTTGSLPDTQPPTVPTGLNAVSSSPTKVDLSWGAASDNVAVTGYTIYRDGGSLTTVSGSTLSFSDTTVAPATAYTYTVDAFDQAGNHSSKSGPAAVTTQSLATSLTFGPVADTYVSASSPTSNYGTATTLRTDGSPDLHGYLRFNVQGIAGRTISKVTLKLYANSSSNQGIQILAVSDNSWIETAVNYNTAPALGSALNAPAPFPTGAYVSFDITGYITADGVYNLGFLTPSSTAISLQSREASSNNPQLILEFN
jgi:chitodextrinase